ncbi:hypothetical protein [Nocardioides daeguensis]|uniref:Uncharacterized protein n=1 Tax=Nocardioides daeguensis TaxID=908359 RepID=A0ABP6USQ5_9ACTN|nr:hypothetical protein [Nocardioides daeguensis]MBV6725660.1 hypothetical protein [Nocardioides daeguensis]MCR1772825.1 hypothetical protein [Nocardioides daeguensis]
MTGEGADATYDTYEPGAVAESVAESDAQPDAQSDAVGGQGPWRVLIEYANRGDLKPPTVVQIGRTEHAERAVALEAALRACHEFNPPDPTFEQSRQVYRDGPDGFLVVLEGAMSTFHMSVRIVSPLAPAGQ